LFLTSDFKNVFDAFPLLHLLMGPHFLKGSFVCRPRKRSLRRFPEGVSEEPSRIPRGFPEDSPKVPLPVLLAVQVLFALFALLILLVLLVLLRLFRQFRQFRLLRSFYLNRSPIPPRPLSAPRAPVPLLALAPSRARPPPLPRLTSATTPNATAPLPLALTTHPSV
jgi:hypothetical protein